MNFISAASLAMFVPLIAAAVVVLRRTRRKAAGRRLAKLNTWNLNRWSDAATSPQVIRRARRSEPRSVIRRAA